MAYFFRKFPVLSAGNDVADDEAQRFEERVIMDLFEAWGQIGENEDIILKATWETIEWLKR